MKGTYKVYDSNKGEWVNLDHTAAYDNVRIKIENNHLWVSYNYDQGPWEDKGEIISSTALNEKADKTYVDDNFAKKGEASNYIVNGTNNDSVKCVVVDEVDTFAKSGFEINNGHATLQAEVATGSSSTSGGGIKIGQDGIAMSSWIDEEENTISLSSDGFKYNDREILHTDEDGNLNVKNLSIRDLVVSEDIPYRYSFVGKLPFATPGGIGHYYVEADLENDAVEYYRGGPVYSFVVNYCWSTDEGEYSSEHWNGGKLKLPAYLIDPEYSDEGDELEFIEGKTENVEIYGSNAEYEDEDTGRLYPEGYFIRSIPFSIRKPTKVTLNGHKLVTKDVLNSTEKNILSKCVPSNAVETNSDWTRISKIGKWDEDDSIDKHSSASVSKDQVVLFSSRNDPDGNFESISVKITSEGFVIERSWEDMGEFGTDELFKITKFGVCYINGNPINQ